MSTEAVNRILVPIAPGNMPHPPLILADDKFLSALTAAEAKVGALMIKDIASAQAASILLNELTTSGKQLEDSRTTLKAPFIAMGRQIDACAKIPTDRIENLKGKVRKALATYADETRKAAEKAERERQEEIKRLEAEQRRQQEEADRKAKEAAATAGPIDLDFDEPAPESPPPAKTAIDRKLEELKHPPALPAAAAPAGIRTVTRLVFKVEDVAKLPDAFVHRTANDMLIRQTYCVGYKEGDPVPSLPGVTFTVDKTVTSTGRNETPVF